VDAQLSQPWAPQTYTRLLTDAEFLGHVQRREPFIVRFGSAQNMSATLGWGTQAWLGEAGRVYLQRAVGDKEKVLVESRPHFPASVTADDHKDHTPNVGNFGFGLDAHRKFMSFSDLLASDFANAHGNESMYLNIQQPDVQHPEEVYRTPLHLLKADIPLPAMLRGVAENITEVNLWMGVARDRDAQSKLHMDATDNLYVVLEGAKQFTIASPADALKVGTVSPTIAVSPDGMSFQFNVRKFSGYLKWKAQKEQAELAAAAAASVSRNSSNGGGDNVASSETSSTESKSVSGSDVNTDTALLLPSALQEHLVRKDIEYEAANFHFSLLDANAPAQQQRSAQCDPDAPHFTTFTLQAGDMLYLPTGWFHQVVSKQGRHMAVNYWWRALNWRGAVEFERARSEAVFEQLRG
jgi:mannose-6-phosphate isomerase-like protein (cupin superfamily)